MKALTAITLLIVTLILSGCQTKTQVGGKILFEDGTPCYAGCVIFDDGKNAYTGMIKEDGTYEIAILKNKGLPPGTYKVYFSSTDTPDPATIVDSDTSEKLALAGKAVPPPTMIRLLDEKYGSIHTTDLMLEVKGGKMTHDITVPKYKP
jgi:hypothetical protein